MGLPYLTTSQIKEQKTLIKGYLNKGSWFQRMEQEASVISSRIKALKINDPFIIDVGSGNGRMLNFLKDKGFYNSVGFDIDNYTQDAWVSERIRIVDLHHDTWPVSDQGAHVVIAAEVMEHLENPFFMIREAARVLKRGGLFFLSIPNVHTISGKWQFFLSGNLLGYREDNNHISFLSPAVFEKIVGPRFDLEETLYSHGYLFKRYIRRVNRFLPPHRWWSNKICYVLRRK